jgi:hypothetical protein
MNHFFEVARDVADGRLLLGQLRLQPFELRGESFRQRLDRVALRLLDELALAGEHFFHRLEQVEFPLDVETELLSHPVAQII